MKKTLFLLVFGLASATVSFAQNKKMYVSRHGGTKKVLTLDKIGYNSYYFSNRSNSTDSLICCGSGFEICRVDKDIIKLTKEQGLYYKTMNKAIRKTERTVKKTKSSSGQLTLNIDNQNLSVK